METLSLEPVSRCSINLVSQKKNIHIYKLGSGNLNFEIKGKNYEEIYIYVVAGFYLLFLQCIINGHKLFQSNHKKGV